MKMNSALSVSFANWPNPVGSSEEIFAKLLSLALGREVVVQPDPHGEVDICIESVYSRKELPSFQARTYRFLASHTKAGINFSNRKYSPNQQRGAVTGNNHRQAGDSQPATRATHQESVSYPRPSLIQHETGCIVVERQKHVNRRMLVNPRGPRTARRYHHCR